MLVSKLWKSFTQSMLVMSDLFLTYNAKTKCSRLQNNALCKVELSSVVNNWRLLTSCRRDVNQEQDLARVLE